MQTTARKKVVGEGERGRGTSGRWTVEETRFIYPYVPESACALLCWFPYNPSRPSVGAHAHPEPDPKKPAAPSTDVPLAARRPVLARPNAQRLRLLLVVPPNLILAYGS